MDKAEEERLMKLFEEVPTPSGSSASEFEPNSSDLSSSNNEDVEQDNNTEDEDNDTDQSENDIDNEQDDETWHEDVKDIANFNFDNTNCGVQFPVNSEMTPIDIFSKIFDRDILDIVINSTNHYGENLTTQSRPHTRYSRKTKFKPTDEKEMKKFFGLCLLQGQISCPSIRKLFSYDQLYYHPIFQMTMSGRRFEQLLRCLNVECNEELYHIDRLKKIKHFMNTLMKKFQNSYYPGEQLSLDESLLLHRGRLSFRTYIKGKKAKYGIKLYELCTPEGYVINIEVYKGKMNRDENDSTRTILQNLVLRIMDPYLDKGHHLYMDNYYNSIALSTILLSRKTHTTGTLRSNRVGVPHEISKKKLKKSEHIWRRCNNVYISKWKDKREVLCITTGYHPEMVTSRNRLGVESRKPKEVVEYNTYMSGIDRVDQMISYYSCPRKTIRWYKKMIFHLLDVTVWNAYYIFRSCVKPNENYITFKEALIRQLLDIGDTNKSVPKLFLNKTTKVSTANPSPNDTETNAPQHFLAKIPIPENYKRKTYFLRCKQCSQNKKRKETSWYCKTCVTSTPLCPGKCFEEWHNNLH